MNIEKHNARTRKANEAFAALPKNEQRVQIARDVIAQIRSQKLTPSHNTWLKVDAKADVNENLTGKEELCDVLRTKVATCNACALGAVFACAVQRADRFKVGKLVGEKDDFYYPQVSEIDIDMGQLFSYLKRFFTVKQLKLIECAFEYGQGGVHIDDLDEKAYDQAIGFADVSEDEEISTWDAGVRMILIMRNIIRNDGTFVPAMKPTKVDFRIALAATRPAPAVSEA